MHPDNNPLDLASGQLFVKDPETGETLPLSIDLGSGDTLAEFTIPDTTDQDELHAKAVQYLKEMDLPPAILEQEAVVLSWLKYQEQYIQPMVAACTALLQIVDEQYNACMNWAKENRRKWLHIGRTTKKARTRKKYANLIWRDYKAAQAAALARIAGEG